MSKATPLLLLMVLAGTLQAADNHEQPPPAPVRIAQSSGNRDIDRAVIGWAYSAKAAPTEQGFSAAINIRLHGGI